MPNLRDNIEKEIEQGNLGDTFSPKEIKELDSRGGECVVGGQRYQKSSVTEILANNSIGPGDRRGESVKRGGERLFQKHEGRGRYSLFENDGLDLDEQKECENLSVTTDLDDEAKKHRIACNFVDYLRSKPFRISKATAQGRYWYPKKGAAIGWEDRLNHYFWGGKNWKENSKIVNSIISDLDLISIKYKCYGRSAELEIEAKELFDRIIKWGNPKATRRNGVYIFDRLEELWSGKISFVDSTLTKLYAFALPSEYIIYDSRVASALLSIAEDIYRFRTVSGKRIETVNSEFSSVFPCLGIYDGSGGTRPRGYRFHGWPSAYRSVSAQMDANDLCINIMEVLNENCEDGRTNWSLREVEAVLFMEGY